MTTTQTCMPRNRLVRAYKPDTWPSDDGLSVERPDPRLPDFHPSLARVLEEAGNGGKDNVLNECVRKMRARIFQCMRTTYGSGNACADDGRAAMAAEDAMRKEALESDRLLAEIVFCARAARNVCECTGCKKSAMRECAPSRKRAAGGRRETRVISELLEEEIPVEERGGESRPFLYDLTPSASDDGGAGSDVHLFRRTIERMYGIERAGDANESVPGAEEVAENPRIRSRIRDPVFASAFRKQRLHKESSLKRSRRLYLSGKIARGDENRILMVLSGKSQSTERDSLRMHRIGSNNTPMVTFLMRLQKYLSVEETLLRYRDQYEKAKKDLKDEKIRMLRCALLYHMIMRERIDVEDIERGLPDPTMMRDAYCELVYGEPVPRGKRAQNGGGQRHHALKKRRRNGARSEQRLGEKDMAGKTVIDLCEETQMNVNCSDSDEDAVIGSEYADDACASFYPVRATDLIKSILRTRPDGIGDTHIFREQAQRLLPDVDEDDAPSVQYSVNCMRVLNMVLPKNVEEFQYEVEERGVLAHISRGEAINQYREAFESGRRMQYERAEKAAPLIDAGLLDEAEEERGIAQNKRLRDKYRRREDDCRERCEDLFCETQTCFICAEETDTIVWYPSQCCTENYGVQKQCHRCFLSSVFISSKGNVFLSSTQLDEHIHVRCPMCRTPIDKWWETKVVDLRRV